MKKYKRITIKIEQEYIVEMQDNGNTAINDWPIDHVIQEWFVEHHLDVSHAARDNHKVAGATKFISAKYKDL